MEVIVDSVVDIMERVEVQQGMQQGMQQVLDHVTMGDTVITGLRVIGSRRLPGAEGTLSTQAGLCVALSATQHSIWSISVRRD